MLKFKLIIVLLLVGLCYCCKDIHVSSNNNVILKTDTIDNIKYNQDTVIIKIFADSLINKKVIIKFDSNTYILDDKGKDIIDKEFVDIAKYFKNYNIRIEGHTDNMGTLDDNIELSHKRAESVAYYLKEKHDINSGRFIIIGSGPSNAVVNNIKGHNNEYNFVELFLKGTNNY